MAALQMKAEVAPRIIDGAIDYQSQWVIFAEDGEVVTREKLMRVGFIRIRQRCDGKVIASAPGMEDLTIPCPACESDDERDLPDDAWKGMGIEVSKKCTRWVESFLGGKVSGQ